MQVFRARCIAEGTGLIVAAAYLFYDNIKVSLLFLPYLYVHYRIRIKAYRISEKEKTMEAFRDGIRIVSSLLQTGYSVENAFRGTMSEMKSIYGIHNPVYSGFSQINNMVKLNVPIETAFGKYAEGTEVEEIRYFAEILKYAKRSGGNLVAIITDTVEIISDRIDVKREIRTIMASKKLEQNIMNFVPAGIIMYMKLSSFGTMERLYGNISGIIIMTVCLAIYVSAVILVGKISNVQV